MPKIYILGGSGSGKTTLAEEIAARLQIPLYSLDTFVDKPTHQALIEGVIEIAEQPGWVAEGIYLLWTDPLLYRADYNTMAELGLDADTVIPHHLLPPAIELRPAQPAHYGLIAASVREAYQIEKEGGRFDEVDQPDEFLQSLRHPKHDPTLWQVAWAGAEVVGQVLSVIERGRAEVFEVSVRPAWRRRGFARALLAQAAQTVRARGVDVIRLHTNLDFKTRAVDLYQSVGFRLLKEFPRYRKPFDQTIQVQE